jgi:hypothetical protein
LCTISTTGTLNINSGNLTNYADGTLNNEGILNHNAQFDSLKNFGTLNNTGTGTLNINLQPTGGLLNYGKLNNEGHVNVMYTLANIIEGDFNNSGTLTSTGFLFNDSTLTNSGDIYNSGSIRNWNDGTLNNTGTLSNTSSVENFGTLSNTGTLTNDKTLGNRGILTNTNTLNNYSGSTLNNYSGATLTNDGTLNNTGLLNNNTGGTLYNNSGATLTNDGNLRNYGALNNKGDLVNNDRLLSGGSLTNDGTLTNNSWLNFNNGNLQNNGTLTNNGTMYGYGGSMTNTGTLDITATGSLKINIGFYGTEEGFTQTTGNTIVNGSLVVTGPLFSPPPPPPPYGGGPPPPSPPPRAATIDIQGGSLSGSGSIEASQIIIGENATVKPGNSPGTLIMIGDVDFFGTLQTEIESSSLYDVLEVQGIVTLADSSFFNFSFDGSYIETDGDSFDFLTAFDFDFGLGADFLSWFDSSQFSVTGLDTGFDWSVSYTDYSGFQDSSFLSLNIFADNVVGNPNAVSAPGTLVLFGVSLSLIGWGSRRRSKLRAKS